MNHISIEGMDGVGKTTICRELSKRLGYEFIEKPLHFIFDDEGSVSNYRRISKKVNENENRNFTAWYYGLNNIYLYEKFKDQNIITDRHIVSNYCWSGSSYNMDIYNLILKKIGKPTITIILYAKPEAILSRLKGRNAHDPDIKKLDKSEKAYEKMIYFCELKKLDYIIVDSTGKTVDEVVEEILVRINKK